MIVFSKTWWQFLDLAAVWQPNMRWASAMPRSCRLSIHAGISVPSCPPSICIRIPLSWQRCSRNWCRVWSGRVLPLSMKPVIPLTPSVSIWSLVTVSICRRVLVDCQRSASDVQHHGSNHCPATLWAWSKRRLSQCFTQDQELWWHLIYSSWILGHLTGTL